MLALDFENYFALVCLFLGRNCVAQRIKQIKTQLLTRKFMNRNSVQVVLLN